MFAGKKIGPDPRNFNQRVSLGRNDLLIRTFPKSFHPPFKFFNKCANFLKNSLFFFVLYCGFKGLSLGSVSFNSVPFSVAYSRFKDVRI